MGAKGIHRDDEFVLSRHAPKPPKSLAPKSIFLDRALSLLFLSVTVSLFAHDCVCMRVCISVFRSRGAIRFGFDFLLALREPEHWGPNVFPNRDMATYNSRHSGMISV